MSRFSFKFIQNIQDRFHRLVAPFSTRFQKLWDGMNPRDRLLFSGLISAVTLVVLVLVVMALKGRLDAQEELLVTRRQQLVAVEDLRTAYQESYSHMEAIQAKLDVHKGTTLSAFLEKSADKVQIRDNLKQVREKSSSIENELEDKVYSVQLSRVTVEQLSSFLYEVETAGYPMLIRSSKIRTVGAPGNSILEITFEISAFQILEKSQEEG